MRRGMNFGDGKIPALVGVMVLLDRSGSMASIAAAMETHWQAFVAQQRALAPDGMWVTLHQFDGQGYDVTYDRTPLAQVGPLGLEPRGSTPLKDALWRFATEARAVVDDPADLTERLLLVIITDGGENASTQGHTWAQVREQLQGLESAECEAVWLGTTAALLEAEEQVPTFAQAGGSVAYTPSGAGAGYATQAMGMMVNSVRTGGTARGMSASVVANTTRADAVDTAWADEQWKKAVAKMSETRGRTS